MSIVTKESNPELSAKEMFDKLGYELVFENEEVLRYRNGKLDVEFWKVYEYITGEKIKKILKISTVYNQPYLVRIELFKAINKQIEELGWLDEK